MFARAKKGTLRVVSQGREYLLDGEFQQLPDALAIEISPHVNVEVVEKLPTVELTAEAPADETTNGKGKGKAKA